MTDPTVPNLTPDERQQVLAEGRRRVRNRQRVGIAAGALVLLAVLLPMAFMLGSSHDDSKKVLVGGNGSTTSTAPSTLSTTTAPPTPVAPSSTMNTAPSSTAPQTTAAPVALAVQTIVPDQATKDALRQAFLDYKHMKSDEIEPDPARNSVSVAYVPAVHTWWATAIYTPTAAMTFQHSVNMQDDGGQGIFSRWDDGQWHMIAAGGAPCMAWGVIPNDVLRAWNTPESNQSFCDVSVPPTGASQTVVDADYYLVPIGWHVTPLSNVGGPKWSGTMTDPTSSARIDVETVEGWGNGPGGLLNADGSANLDSAAANAMTGCAPTSWVHLDQSSVTFACAATPDGLEVRGLFMIGSTSFPTKMVKVTMPPADHDLATAIMNFQHSWRVGPGPDQN